MKKKTHSAEGKRALLSCVTFGALSFLFTLLVLFFDVSPVGAQQTRVGLSHMNLAVHEAIGVHMLWYDITKYLGVVALAVAFLFALTGFMQLIRRKSFKKVDRALFFLGVVFLIVIALYVFFEVVIINYRPILMPGEETAEASFPSSHTMMACVIFGAAIPACRRLWGNTARTKIASVVCVVFSLVMIGGRLYSGVHWLSDIIAGVLFSLTLISLYVFFCDFVDNI